jgi:hypothetical protein
MAVMPMLTLTLMSTVAYAMQTDMQASSNKPSGLAILRVKI